MITNHNQKGENEMKTVKMLFISAVLILFLQEVLFAQYPAREDVIWARMAPAGSITMDGVLDEPEWADAESIAVNYGTMDLLPTSGWRAEFQEFAVTDPTHATFKVLVTDDNMLWLGFDIPDSSIGGTQDWARWDGILFNIPDKSTLNELLNYVNATEFFLSWWYVNIDSMVVPGAPPRFIGRWGNFDDTTRTPEQRAAWDAATVVHGTSNDAGRDEGWTVEMRIALDSLGYDVTQPDGDVVMFNFSIWDCDYLFEGNPGAISTTRTHFQSPWGNTISNDLSRVYARPDVTVSSGTLPDVDPDVVLPSNNNYSDPVIDGMLDDDVWSGAYTFEMAWDDDNIKYSYPGIGPWISGHFQPELITGSRPPIVDPSHATVRMFFKDNDLYLSADIDDQDVEGSPVVDKIDGIRFMIGDREALNDDHVMIVRMLRVNFDAAGDQGAFDFLKSLVDSGKAEYGVKLKGATTVNNNTDIDEGFTVELKVDLTGLGYPSGLGDKLLFMGADLYDGDTFEDTLSNYATRTWWFREHDGSPALAWMYMDPATPVGVENETASFIPNSIKLYGNYPNPFNPTTRIKYSVPESGVVTISIYNTLGEELKKFTLHNTAGSNEFEFDASNLASGIYFYRVTLDKPVSGNEYQSKTSKMVLLK
jgi:hypothetical protein